MQSTIFTRQYFPLVAIIYSTMLSFKCYCDVKIVDSRVETEIPRVSNIMFAVSYLFLLFLLMELIRESFVKILVHPAKEYIYFYLVNCVTFTSHNTINIVTYKMNINFMNINFALRMYYILHVK